MKTVLLLLLVCFALVSSPVHGRVIKGIDYDELTAKADLVVLAVPYRSEVAADPFPGTAPAESLETYDALNTDFEVLTTVKNDGPVKKEIRVLHFLYTLRPKKIARLQFDGCTFVKFLGEGAPKNLEPTPMNPLWGGQGTVWLAYLKRRVDGRYEAVTGQVDPSMSFRVLNWNSYDFGERPEGQKTSAPDASSKAQAGSAPGSLAKRSHFRSALRDVLGLLGGVLFISAPWIVRECRSSPRWFRQGLVLSGAAAIAWGGLGFALNAPSLFDVHWSFSHVGYAFLYTGQWMCGGIFAGIVILMFSSGEMLSRRPRPKM